MEKVQKAYEIGNIMRIEYSLTKKIRSAFNDKFPLLLSDFKLCKVATAAFVYEESKSDPIESYPKDFTNFLSEQVGQHVHALCFLYPDACPAGSAPKYHTFAITSEIGIRQYGHCLSWRLKDQKKSSAICVLSSHLHLEPMKQFLYRCYVDYYTPENTDHRISFVPRLTVLIDELIVAYGSKATYTLYGLNRKTELPITFSIPSNTVEKIPRAILNLELLFEVFRIGDIIKLFEALLLTKTICFISEKPSLLMHISIALSQLLWPFDLEVISFFPIAPMQLWEQNSEILFQAPFPMVFGIPKQYGKEGLLTVYDILPMCCQTDMYIVDIDTGNVAVSAGTKHLLPETIKKSLATELEQILYPDIAYSDLVGQRPRTLTPEERQKEIQGAFFKAVAEIFDGIDFGSEVMELKQQISSKNTPFYKQLEESSIVYTKSNLSTPNSLLVIGRKWRVRTYSKHFEDTPFEPHFFEPKHQLVKMADQQSWDTRVLMKERLEEQTKTPPKSTDILAKKLFFVNLWRKESPIEMFNMVSNLEKPTIVELISDEVLDTLLHKIPKEVLQTVKNLDSYPPRIERFILKTAKLAQIAPATKKLFDLLTMRDLSENEIKDLIAQGADLDSLNQFGETVLFVAAQNGRLGSCLVLIDQGAPITSDILYYLCNILPRTEKMYFDFVQVTVKLVLQGFDINEGKKPLQKLLSKDYLSLPAVEFLLKLGADPSITDETGHTLIDWMLTLENDSALEVIWLLLRFGFNVNAYPKLKLAVQNNMAARKSSIIVSKISNAFSDDVKFNERAGDYLEPATSAYVSFCESLQKSVLFLDYMCHRVIPAIHHQDILALIPADPLRKLLFANKQLMLDVFKINATYGFAGFEKVIAVLQNYLTQYSSFYEDIAAVLDEDKIRQCLKKHSEHSLSLKNIAQTESHNMSFTFMPVVTAELTFPQVMNNILRFLFTFIDLLSIIKMSYPDVKSVVDQLKTVSQKTSKFTNELILNSLGVASNIAANPMRFLIKHGDLMLLKGSDKEESVRVLLFSDVLIISGASMAPMVMQTSSLFVYDIPDFAVISKKYFLLASGKETYILSSKVTEEKWDWMRSLYRVSFNASIKNGKYFGVDSYAMFGKFVHEDFIDIKSSVLTWQCFHCRLHEHHLVLFLDERDKYPVVAINLKKFYLVSGKHNTLWLHDKKARYSMPTIGLRCNKKSYYSTTDWKHVLQGYFGTIWEESSLS